MASIKIKYRASQAGGGEGTLYYQVIHKRIIKQIKTNYGLLPEEWDKQAEEIRLSSDGANGRKEELVKIKEKVAWDLKRLQAIVAFFQRRGENFTVEEVAFAFRHATMDNSLFTFMENLVAHLRQLGKARTSETYQTTLNSFRGFRGGRDVMWDEVDADLMGAYEAYLKERRVSMNTISFYMRILRAVYNRAVEKELTVQRFPFKHVYTGIEKTVKRAVPLEAIRRIKRLELEGEPGLQYARDLFLFSFYTRGMSFVDMAYLRKEDLKNGVLSYRRKKTGQRLFIEWEACMQRIVDRYSVEGSPYLLPIIRQGGKEERKQYKNAIHLVNRKLKEIARRIGLAMPFTMYVARHSWASIARSKHIPVSVISEGMGHDSETTTLIYLTSLDSTAINKANRRILNDL